MLCAQAWKPGSQHAGEKRGVAGLLLGRTERHFSLSCIGEGNGNPTPVFLPGESQGRGSLVGRYLWGCTESDAHGFCYIIPSNLQAKGTPWQLEWKIRLPGPTQEEA